MKHKPLTPIVVCPACGAKHRAALIWRKRVERDEDVEPELMIGAEESPS